MSILGNLFGSQNKTTSSGQITIKVEPDEHWPVYEANVQAYRSNFLSSQSIFLAVGAIALAERNLILITVLAVLALIQIWYIWFRVIYARICIVDFHKYRMYNKFDDKGNYSENSPPNPLNEKQYVRDRKIRKKVNEMFADKFYNIRMTRFKIDVLIPVILTALWCYFVVYCNMSK